MIKINEIFYSIQGETSYIGRPSIFIRLTGCNLRCSYCDTKYAYYKGKNYSLNEILKKVKNFSCSLITITGGEPLLQKEAYNLITKFHDIGYQVLVETNGTLDFSGVDKRSKVIMDIKCPNSNESDKIFWDNIKNLKLNDEVKFIITDKIDYDWAKEIIKLHNLSNREILFSPVLEKLNPKTLAKWILKDKISVRLQPQLHKILDIK